MFLFQTSTITRWTDETAGDVEAQLLERINELLWHTVLTLTSLPMLTSRQQCLFWGCAWGYIMCTSVADQHHSCRTIQVFEWFSSVQLLSRVWLFVTPWTAARQTSLSITNCRSLLKLMSIGSVMPSNHLILCRPLLLPPSIFPSIRVFPNESVLHIRWPKNWSFSFNMSPSNEYSGLISFRIDWLDHLAVQGTLKSLLQHHSSKASILQCSAFFMKKNFISIHTRLLEKPWLWLDEILSAMSLFFNMLSICVTTFLPRSKHLLISWLQSLSAMILDPKKMKSDTVSIVSQALDKNLYTTWSTPY